VLGWRTTYGLTSILLGIGIIPLTLWLLRKSFLGQQANSNGTYIVEKTLTTTMKSWTRREMLSDWRFYLLLPAVVAPSFIGTALFFHHLTLAEAKNWSAVWFTGSYWVYAVGSMTASLTFGPVIDRMTAIKSVPFFLMPKICALIIIWAFNDPIWAWPYLLLMGRIIWPQASWSNSVFDSSDYCFSFGTWTSRNGLYDRYQYKYGKYLYYFCNLLCNRNYIYFCGAPLF
jgi:hypothetical protein